MSGIIPVVLVLGFVACFVAALCKWGPGAVTPQKGSASRHCCNTPPEIPHATCSKDNDDRALSIQ